MRGEGRWLWYWIPMAVFFIGISSIVLLLWVNRINESARMDALIVDAIMDVQIKVSTSHLWLEEAVSGDDTADEALADMNKALNLINVVINGGESEHGLIPEPLEDRELRGHAEELRSLLVNFKIFALERLRNPGEAGIASNIEQKFDVAFKEILKKAGALEDIIKNNDAGERAKSGRLFLGILSAWAFIVIAATAGLWSRERRRKSAEEALLKANEQLLSQTKELTEHREHLAELVEARTAEVTAANELLQVENSRRRRMEEEIRELNEELELKIAERTRQLLDTQEELVRSEKLAMLGQIAGNMGNELRNPLGVMNNAVFFLETVLPDADGLSREYLEIIRSEIDSSQRIISDLCDFCQDRPRRAETIVIHELITACLAGSAIPEDIRLLADLPESLPPVKVDPLQIGQVFRNLIANAVQAMPDGGSLRVAARRVRSEESGERSANVTNPSQDFVEISVEDTGTGIAPENMTKLFQPLFTTKSRGIGLGLSISRKLVEANGGRIEVESRSVDGATFTVTLPVEGE